MRIDFLANITPKARGFLKLFFFSPEKIRKSFMRSNNAISRLFLTQHLKKPKSFFKVKFYFHTEGNFLKKSFENYLGLTDSIYTPAFSYFGKHRLLSILC